MNNLKKNLLVVTGGVLCVIALGIFLGIFGYNVVDFALLIAAAFVLYMAMKYKNIALRNISVFYLPFSIAATIDIIFNIPFVYFVSSLMFALTLSFAAMYVLYRRDLFAYAFVASLGIGIFLILSVLMKNKILLSAYLFMVLGLISLILYLINYKKWGNIPLFVSIILYLYSALNLLLYKGIIAGSLYTASNAAILLLAGVSIIVYVFKTEKK